MYKIFIGRRSAALYLQKEFGTRRAVEFLKSFAGQKNELPIYPFGKLKTKAAAQKTLDHVKMIIFYQQGRLGKNLTDPAVYYV